MKHILESQQTPHTSPSRATYGVSSVRFLNKIDRVIAAPRCISFHAHYLALVSNIQISVHILNGLKMKMFKND